MKQEGNKSTPLNLQLEILMIAQKNIWIYSVF